MADGKPLKSDNSNKEEGDGAKSNKPKTDENNSDSASSQNTTRTKSRAHTLTFRRKRNSDKTKDQKSNQFWTFRFKKQIPGRLKKGKGHGLPDTTLSIDNGSCVCTGYRRTEDHVLGPGIVFSATEKSEKMERDNDDEHIYSTVSHQQETNSDNTTDNVAGAVGNIPNRVPGWNRLTLMTTVPAPPPQRGLAALEAGSYTADEYPTDDIDELLIAQRRRDMERGLDITPHQMPYPGYPLASQISMMAASTSVASLATSFQNQCVVTTTYPMFEGGTFRSPEQFRSSAEQFRSPEQSTSNAPRMAATANLQSAQQNDNLSMFMPSSMIPGATVHTQVDYIHCLVPDLKNITTCSFYWGIMDRYEAERLLENRPEGSFLLRDSAQEEFLFSVSFRRYGRSLHARIEQWNHKFSFDSHDPGVFASDTVCGLIEHYKDPSCCMFFEPMLTIPLTRNFPFSLQYLCRTVICSNTTYDGTNLLPLPKPLKEYLKYYHYKQKVRVRRFEMQS